MSIPIHDARLRRFAMSALLREEPQPEINNDINTTTTAVYGNPHAALGFRLGNGGAGYTGLLKTLSEAFIAFKARDGGPDFRIEWVANHSRHTQIALLGNIVQVALTYEPDWEIQAVREGWAARRSRVFNDRFVLVGPKDDPAGVEALRTRNGNDDIMICLAMQAIACHGRRVNRIVTHYRGDGSATSYKEMQLWGMSGVDLADSKSWRHRSPLTPRDALIEADQAGVYIITDRATFLTAQRDGAISRSAAFVERGCYLNNPCSVLINPKVEQDNQAKLGREFASWLGGTQAQDLIRTFGMDWSTGLPVFAQAREDQVDQSRWSLVRAKL